MLLLETGSLKSLVPSGFCVCILLWRHWLYNDTGPYHSIASLHLFGSENNEKLLPWFKIRTCIDGFFHCSQLGDLRLSELRAVCWIPGWISKTSTSTCSSSILCEPKAKGFFKRYVPRWTGLLASSPTTLTATCIYGLQQPRSLSYLTCCSHCLTFWQIYRLLGKRCKIDSWEIAHLDSSHSSTQVRKISAQEDGWGKLIWLRAVLREPLQGNAFKDYWKWWIYRKPYCHSEEILAVLNAVME